jgi:hypothetical protein
MKENKLSEYEIINDHLTLFKEGDSQIEVSSLVAALRDARYATGRDINTGEDIDKGKNQQKSSWLGTLCYLIILDQLGKCYKAKSDPVLTDLNPIQRCLKLNTQLSDDEINVVYALRNALVHDYSLSNINKGNPSLTHHFTLVGFYSKPFIKMPLKKWDGRPSTKTHETVTLIGLPWIGKFVERIYLTHLDLHKKGDLQIILKGGALEIKKRYLLYASDK